MWKEVGALASLHESFCYLTGDIRQGNVLFRSLLCLGLATGSCWSLMYDDLSEPSDAYHTVSKVQIAYLLVDLAHMARVRCTRTSLYVHHIAGLLAFWYYSRLSQVQLLLMTTEFLSVFNWLSLTNNKQLSRVLTYYRLCVIMFYRIPLAVVVATYFGVRATMMIGVLDSVWMYQMVQSLCTPSTHDSIRTGACAT